MFSSSSSRVRARVRLVHHYYVLLLEYYSVGVGVGVGVATRPGARAEHAQIDLTLALTRTLTLTNPSLLLRIHSPLCELHLASSPSWLQPGGMRASAAMRCVSPFSSFLIMIWSMLAVAGQECSS